MPSIRSFVSRLPLPLLQSFLHSHSMSLSPERLDGTATMIADAIDDELAALPPGSRGKFMHQMETVDRLSNEAGEVAIDSMTLHEGLAELPSKHARALWLFLNDRDGFRRAEEIVYNDERRYGRLWASFAGPKGGDLRREPEAQEAFRQSLRVAFDTPNVHIEIFDRTRPEFVEDDPVHAESEVAGTASLCQITIYREDRPNAEPTFIDGEFTIRTHRPVIEASLTYEPTTGTIECVAAQRHTRDEVVRHFATAMLGCAPDFEPCMARSYDLTVLRERMEFATDPVDRIEDVSVSLLRLQPVETNAERITVEKLPGADRDIWSAVEERLGKDALRSSYLITQARILIRYRSGESNRIRSLPVMITHPHKSNIKEQREIERVVSGKYLPRWGLVVSQ